MMATEFKVIRFTPDPEAIEPANVAILVNDRPPRLLFDPEFQRLSCLAPGFSTANLLLWLEDLRDLVQTPNVLGAGPEDVVRGSSSQFSLSEPKSLAAYWSREVESLLVQRYLCRHVHGEKREVRGRREERVEAKLHNYLVRTFHVPEAVMLRRASPTEFLGPKVLAGLRGNGFTCHRVINGRRGLVVVNGFSLTSGQPADVEERAHKIAFALYRLGQVKDLVKRFEDRTLHRATVVFGGVPADSPHAPRYEFARSLGTRECEHVLDGESTDAGFDAAVREAAAGLVL